MKKWSILQRYTAIIGSVVIAAIVIFSLLTGDTNERPKKYTVVEGLNVEEGAQIKLSKRADLFGSALDATIALVVLPLQPQQDYKGYLGVWDSSGELVQKFVVNGYNILFPLEINVLDITADGIPDIILETDERANGGLGVEVLHIYVSDNGSYIEASLPDTVDKGYTATYRPSSNDFMMSSNADNRRWAVHFNDELLRLLDTKLLNQPVAAVNVDPVSSIDLQNNILTTKRLMWFGNLQLNSLAVVATSYSFEANNWVIKNYHLESVEGSSVVTEIQ
jgi:hypothetical protein